MRIRVDVGTTNSEGVRSTGGQRTIAAWQRKRKANIKVPESCIAQTAGKSTARKRTCFALGIAGGPTDDESLSQWTARLRKESAEQKRSKQKIAEQSRPRSTQAFESGRGKHHCRWTCVLVRGGRYGARLSGAGIFLPSGGGTHSRKPWRVLDVKRLLGKPAADVVRLGTELTDREKLRELDRLVAMAKTLGEITSKHTEDEGLQRKEAGLALGPKEYYTAIRGGVCNAYLAASVVASGLVSARKIGAIGKAGTALQLMSGAVPLVGGLAGFTGAALKAGDCYVQTRRVAKITGLAPDAVECCKLARMLALRLTDGLPDGPIDKSRDTEEKRKHDAAGVGWGAGGSKFGVMKDSVSEEAVMELKRLRITSQATVEKRSPSGIRSSSRVRHPTRRNLDRIGRRSCSISRVSANPRRKPAQILAELEPLKADEEKHSAELEALKADKGKHYAKLEALKAENKDLQGQVATFEKRLPKSQGGPGDSVDAGGGQLLAQERKTKTLNEFMHMENPARAADRQTITLDKHRITKARVEEVGRETGHLDTRVVALEEGNRGKKKGLLHACAAVADWETVAVGSGLSEDLR
ncbi:unnamed protein product [Ectocarpus sp. 12 AP-2014]